MEFSADGAVGAHDEGLVGGCEENLQCVSWIEISSEDGQLTPIAMAGKMYFMRFLTSGKPWCLFDESWLICLSMSPPS